MPDGSQHKPARPEPPGKVRVLFGAAGWPCGVLEIASWAVHEGLARAEVVPVEPGYLFRLGAEDRPYLSEGPVDPELIDSFALHERTLSPDSTVRSVRPEGWEIRDRSRGWTYHLVDAPEGLDVYLLERYEPPESIGAVRRFARSRSRGAELFAHDGRPSVAAREALAAVGGCFIERLIEFDPHVVGFRLESGQFGQVKRFIRAVRLFCDAEVVLGGPTATSHPEEVLEESGADYVFTGEAEEPFNRWLRLAWERNSKDRQPEIPGLAYRYGGRVYVNTLPRDGYERSVLDADRTACGPHATSLRNRVRPAAPAALIAANRLDWSLLEGFDRAEFDSLFFTGGRGCPGACTFCAKLHGPEVRVKSARELLADVEAADALVAAGGLGVTRWPLFAHVDAPGFRDRQAAWAAVYDEDFFLHRRRAIEFFRLWGESGLRHRYRLSVQTNPCSLLDADGRPHAELFDWIDRLKPMVQLGGESFHPELLARWNKRHNLDQLHAVLEALDRTRQDYTVFQLLTDFETTPEELVETLRLLILNAFGHRRMRIASSPFTIPLYDSDARRSLEHRGLLRGRESAGVVVRSANRRLFAERKATPATGLDAPPPTPFRIAHFTDYERPQPGWMDPLAAELADLADAELRFSLQPERREAALVSAFEVVLERIGEAWARVGHGGPSCEAERLRMRHLHDQARRAMDQIKDARFQGIGPFG